MRSQCFPFDRHQPKYTPYTPDVFAARRNPMTRACGQSPRRCRAPVRRKAFPFSTPPVVAARPTGCGCLQSPNTRATAPKRAAQMRDVVSERRTVFDSSRDDPRRLHTINAACAAIRYCAATVGSPVSFPLRRTLLPPRHRYPYGNRRGTAARTNLLHLTMEHP